MNRRKVIPFPRKKKSARSQKLEVPEYSDLLEARRTGDYSKFLRHSPFVQVAPLLEKAARDLFGEKDRLKEGDPSEENDA